MKPESFEFNGNQVFELGDLIRYDQAYFYGCLKRPRNVLTKKNIMVKITFMQRLRNKDIEWRSKETEWIKKKQLLKIIDKLTTA
jgi:hypothetical protein